ncbi:hypothetical protein [Pseudomonas putida]|uniref:hypothetical protein n=1 Tax=Pseudomonas putida TaxID=303 RepID=UPI003D01ED6B
MIDIKHKHAAHVIIIEGKPFKANDSGMWDLTDIWRTLKLPKGKQPGKWVDTKKAKTLEQTGNIGSLNVSVRGIRLAQVSPASTDVAVAARSH